MMVVRKVPNWVIFDVYCWDLSFSGFNLAWKNIINVLFLVDKRNF